MLVFSSIASYLQLKIAEKMDYIDQMEFELSSRHAAQTVALAKHKPAVDVDKLDMHEREIYFFTMSGRVPQTWSRMRRMKYLPRFKVKELQISDHSVSFHFVSELCERANFIENEVTLSVLPHKARLEIVDKLAYIFNITRMNARLLKEEDGNLPWFRKLKSIRMYMDSIPDELIVQLTASTLDLKVLSNTSRFASLSNQIFQQWSRNERNIKYLNISNDMPLGYAAPLNKELLLNGLSFTEITGGYVDSEITARNKDEIYRSYVIEKDFKAFLIEREDSKLLICVNEKRTKTIYAQEVPEVIMDPEPCQGGCRRHFLCCCLSFLCLRNLHGPPCRRGVMQIIPSE